MACDRGKQQDQFVTPNHAKQGGRKCGNLEDKRNVERLPVKKDFRTLRPFLGEAFFLSLHAGVWSGISLKARGLQSIWVNPVYLPKT